MGNVNLKFIQPQCNSRVPVSLSRTAQSSQTENNKFWHISGLLLNCIVGISTGRTNDWITDTAGWCKASTWKEINEDSAYWEQIDSAQWRIDFFSYYERKTLCGEFLHLVLAWMCSHPVIRHRPRSILQNVHVSVGLYLWEKGENSLFFSKDLVWEATLLRETGARCFVH